jgi:NOL1/NOP2/fmu family ribosome biogenesis protein
VVVDAPCSGSGLFRKEPEAINEWSEHNVSLCAQRQQRIVSDCWHSIKPGGILIYSTCSYSIAEDEDNYDWIKNSLQGEPVALKVPEEWGITDTGKGYRFWPDKVQGEGFYISVFRKPEEEEEKPARLKRKPAQLPAKNMEVLGNWMITEGSIFILHGIAAYAWPENLLYDMSLVLQELRVTYSGVLAGELIHGKLVPAHSLAMSLLLSASLEKTELSKEMAIRYLQRKDLDIPPSGIGWKLASFQGHPLGWMNVLKNRINNYYPAPLRIRKES